GPENLGAETRSLTSRVKCRAPVSIETRMPDSAEQNWPDGRIVDRLPVIVYASELGENGRWRYVSPQVEELLGFTPEEILRDPGLWARQTHPDAPRRARAVESYDALGNRDTRPVEYRMFAAAGHTVCMLDEAVLEPD